MSIENLDFEPEDEESKRALKEIKERQKAKLVADIDILLTPLYRQAKEQGIKLSEETLGYLRAAAGRGYVLGRRDNGTFAEAHEYNDPAIYGPIDYPDDGLESAIPGE